ncbi:DUF3179 domain-containing protein [Candidatus Gottesmanbacteria bacterium]|nr:DUF3179 domain-containing protein [Candidatus Gottesmanbacteria bacterium]
MFLLIPIAFISGILTVFSPCVLPILPIILTSGIDGKINRIRGIIVGLVISFTIASLLLATIVRAFGIPADTIRNFAVILLVIFGLSMVFPIIWEKVQIFIERYWKITPVQNQSNGFGGGFLTGVSLGVVWTPCIGPVVATVATLAAVNKFSFGTVLIAFAYALGTGIPLYFIAKGGQKVTSRLTIFKTKNERIRQVFGVVILATAFLIWTGSDRSLQAWTLSHLPASWTQLATTFENKVNVNQSLQEINKKDSAKVTPGSTVIKKVSLQNDFTGAKVKPEDLEQGCFGQDCIPAITNPKFQKASDATWLQDNDVVFTISHKGIDRAYPQRIMNWHEIINDEIAGEPIAITFCPLCGSAVAFERKVDGIITEFGVSGKLHDSDLVMYDRYEGNLWQQITGEAIVGPAARRNEKLKAILLGTTTWGVWKKDHSNGEVLSQDTGYTRNYSQYPYGTYEQDDQIYFGVKNLNKQLQIKTVVYGIEINGKAKAYPASIFDKNASFNDSLDDTKLKLERTNAGEVKVTNLQTNEKIIPLRLFWFAWAAFHPDTEIYKL